MQFLIGARRDAAYNQRRIVAKTQRFSLKRGKAYMKTQIKRILVLLLGLSIAHLGVTLFLLSDLGADPFNVLIQGLTRLIAPIAPLTHGTVHMIVCALIIAILLFVDRSYIKIGTLLCMLCGGPIIDVFMLLLSPLVGAASPIYLRVFALVAGCVILAFGMTIVIKSNAGTGPNDLVAIVFSDKLHKKFSIVRVITDACFVLVGALLGGIFGVGTIVCAFLVGPVAGFFMPYNDKLCRKLIGD